MHSKEAQPWKWGMRRADKAGVAVGGVGWG